MLSSFKCLETREVVEARGVCKRWSGIINENRPLWRILAFSSRTSEEARAVVDQFDEKSGSTIEEVKIKICERLGKAPRRLIQSLQDSRASLLVVKLDLDCYGR